MADSEISELAAKIYRAKRANVQAPTYYAISGTIVDGAAADLEDVAVTVKLHGDTLSTAVTDSGGAFSFPKGFHANTTYQVYAVLAGYTASADPLNVAVAVADVTNADFVLTEV